MLILHLLNSELTDGVVVESVKICPAHRFFEAVVVHQSIERTTMIFVVSITSV